MATAQAQRVDPFAAADDDLPDLSAFKPAVKGERPKLDKAATKETAARAGFKSREPSAAPAQPDPAPVPRSTQRRRTTGRNRQLNLKVTEEALTRFYAVADQQEWVLGQAFDEAVSALEAKLAKG